MNGRLWRWPQAGLLGAALIVLVVAVLVGVTLNHSSDPSDALPASADVSGQDAVPIDLGGREGRRVPRGFLGFSFEFQAVRAYTGNDARHVNPVLVRLIRNLSPGQRPVLRIGGDSTDMSWLPGPGVQPPRYRGYRLTSSWLATTGALARRLEARMIMGLNLSADEPALAAAEAHAFTRAIGAKRVWAFEVGNEPNVYGKIKLLKRSNGTFFRARPRHFAYPQFRRQFGAEASAVPAGPLAGPALAAGPHPDRGSWVGSMPSFLSGQRRLQLFTVHRYPLRNCYVPPRSPQYPSIPHLLSPYATSTLASSLAPWIAIAHGQHRRIRVDELNSVACRGKPGVSDTFASALWIPDALFSLLRAGIDGVNIHTLPKSAYELFHFTHGADGWQAFVQPVYYGLQLFAKAAPPGAHLLGHAGATSTPGLSIWATRTRKGTVHVVLINKSTTARRVVSLGLPSARGRTGTVTRLNAPSVASRGGVSLGGRSYGSATATGALPAPRTQHLTPHHQRYTMALAPCSAALITFSGR